MKYDYCVVGGTGAVGSAIVEQLKVVGSVAIINSKNCDLSQNFFTPPPIRAKTIINAAGTFGGLKQYETNSKIVEGHYISNLVKLCESIHSENVVNISSAAVSNDYNKNMSSHYKEYVSHKIKIEEALDGCGIKNIAHLRCTNIISKYENYKTSGHSIASIYRNIEKMPDILEIWSNKDDWREYVDAEDVAMIVNKVIDRSISGVLNIGSGRLTYIPQVVDYFTEKLKFSGEIVYTQPHKTGPLDSLIGWPVNDFSDLIKPVSFSESLEKCHVVWSGLSTNPRVIRP